MTRRILLVEDDRMIQLFLTELLKDDYDLVSVASIAEAIEKLEKWWASLILLDLVVADGTGVELLEYLKQKDLRIPVIVLSSIKDPDIVAEVKSFGIAAYVRKDQLVEDLTKEIKRVFQNPKKKVWIPPPSDVP